MTNPTNETMTFAVLRAANVARLPRFRNKHGAMAHSQPDGSDWSPAQWFQATLGELGEFAAVRVAYEKGQLSRADLEHEAAKEMADFVTYADILGHRVLDDIEAHKRDEIDTAQVLMRLVAALGVYANAAKKLDRGDLTLLEFDEVRDDALGDAAMALAYLRGVATPREPHKVTVAHASGIDIGQAVVEKFNEVSKRVDAGVFIGFDAFGTPAVVVREQ
jgi:NTP pyrophosphatase (non-canonical NTP hydrolase)